MANGASRIDPSEKVTVTRPKTEHGWLDLKQIATVELTSEDRGFTIEVVFGPEDTRGMACFSRRLTTDPDDLRSAFIYTSYSSVLSGVPA